MPAVPAAEDEGVLAEGQEIVAIPFAKSVLSIFMPGMALAGLLYMLEQQDYAYVIAMANIGFVLYLYSQRLGAAGQMGWKKGVSFNLRNMLEAPKNLLIQERGVEAIRQLVVHKGKADRVAERGGVSILLNILKRHPTQSSLISNVLNTIRAISDAAPLSRRRIFQAIEMKTELSLRMPSSGSDWLNDEDEYVTSSKAILRSFLTVLGSLLDGNSVSLKQLVRSSGVYESVLTLLDRVGMVDTQTVYFGLWSLYQAQHECNETKVFLAKHNFFPVALDCLRANRAHTKINQMGFMVVFEMLFEASESSKSADRPLDCVRFLPESFAHALEAGAFQALTDVQTRHPEIAELANMLHVLKHQLNKKREEEMKIDLQVVDDDCKGPNREYSSPVEEVML